MILSVTDITKNLTNNDFFDIDIYHELESTNKTLKALAALEDIPEGKVIIAESQSGGHGRFGRAFFSPAGTGIYMSILLRPQIMPTEATLITTAAAVAVATALEDICGGTAGIKWINDIFVENRKVCGILTEASFSSMEAFPKYVVLGIGINVFEPDGGFPDELKKIAASVAQASEASYRNQVRGRIIAAVLDNFMKFYPDLSARAFLPEYRNRSLVLGRQVRIMDSEEGTPATALAIDDNCNLVVELADKTQRVLNSGEISIKL